MKILIASDIHGSAYFAKKIPEILENEKAEKLVLLGDLYYHGPRNPFPKDYAPMEVAEVLNNLKEKLKDNFIAIKGNCDAEVDEMISNFEFKEHYVEKINNKIMYFTHGHKNNIDKLPNSLIRSGRFDRTIVMLPPSKKDASKIIEHYLENKKLSSNVNFDDLCKMMSYHSCADLETILNEAAIYAGYNKKDAVDMQDLINAVLRLQYNSPDDLMKKDKDEVRKIAIHEAGHLVVSEVIMPGSIGLASVRTKGRSQTGGFIHRCGEPNKRPHEIMSLLGGKVATEMYYSESCASGCYLDLSRAINSLRDDITENGTNGVAFLEYGNPRYRLSNKNNDIREAVVHSELERFIFETRNVLIQNRAFLEKIADALVEKETLLYSDIKAIRESVEITRCVA